MKTLLQCLSAICAGVSLFLLITRPSCALDKDRGIEIVPSIGHADAISAATFSPDGKLILTASADKTIKLWDAASGRLIRTFTGHSDQVNSVAFSPDGTSIVSGSNDDSVRLWDVATGKLQNTFKHSNYVTSVAFSPDGTLVLSGSWDKTLKLWERASGKLIRSFEGHSNNVIAVAFLPDGKQIISASADRTIRLWDTSSGKLLRSLKGHTGPVTSLAVSLDGTKVASGSDDDTWKLWDIASGRQLRSEKFDFPVSSVVFSPDGKRLASVVIGEDTRFWDIEKGTLVPVPDWLAHAFAFSPDGKHVLSAEGQLSLRDVETGKLLSSFAGQPGEGSAVAFSPDGARLASAAGNDRTVYLWDTATGRLLRGLSGHADAIKSVAFSPDGNRVASGSDDKTLKLWNATSGKLLRTFDGLASEARAVAFSPDGGRILSGSWDGSLKLWDAASGRQLRTLKPQCDRLWSAAFSEDGTQIMSGCNDVATWDAASGKKVRNLAKFDSDNKETARVLFSPDRKRFLVGNWHDKLNLLDSASGKVLRSFDAHTFFGGNSLAFSPDGRLILAAGGREEIVKLWDAANGRLLQNFDVQATSVAFSPDGKLFVTESDGGTLRYWSVETHELLATIVVGKDDEWLVLTREGFFDASKNGARLLSIVRGLNVYSIDQFYDQLHRPDLVREKLAGDPRGLVRDAAAKIDLGKALAAGDPPLVRVASTSQSPFEMGMQAVVETIVTDQGGGIGKVEWRRNGTTIGIEAARDEQVSLGRTVALGHAVSLLPGENHIEIVAYNKQGLVASQPVNATIVAERGPQQSASPRLYILAVGVDEYKYLPENLQLDWAAGDATAVADALRQAGKKLYENVDVRMLLNQDVTLAHLDQAFTALSKQIRPEDVFVLFLTGHGETIDGRFYFLPSDFQGGVENVVAGGIAQQQLQAWLAQLNAQQSVILVGSCESGSLANDRFLRELQERAAVDRLTRAVGRTVITATTANTLAWEGFHGHGVFEYALLSALGRGDRNGDGFIDVRELSDYVDERVPDLIYGAWHETQFPQSKIIGATFPLVAKIGVPPDDAMDQIPKRPTHRVVTKVLVRQASNETSPAVLELVPGAEVRLLATEGNWLLVGQEGKSLGYLPAAASALVSLH